MVVYYQHTYLLVDNCQWQRVGPTPQKQPATAPSPPVQTLSGWCGDRRCSWSVQRGPRHETHLSLPCLCAITSYVSSTSALRLSEYAITCVCVYISLVFSLTSGCLDRSLFHSRPAHRCFCVYIILKPASLASAFASGPSACPKLSKWELGTYEDPPLTLALQTIFRIS
jgi:hypothetical protein